MLCTPHFSPLHSTHPPVAPQVAREIKLHIQLAHDAIIAMYAAWKDANYVYMALEWAPGVSGAEGIRSLELYAAGQACA